MEFLKVYAMAGLPVLFAFAAIWWFMTISIIHHPKAKTALATEDVGRLVESKLLEVIAPPAEWRKAA